MVAERVREEEPLEPTPAGLETVILAAAVLDSGAELHESVALPWLEPEGPSWSNGDPRSRHPWTEPPSVRARHYWPYGAQPPRPNDPDGQRYGGAARRLGLTLDEYRARRAAGERWCPKCRAWRPAWSPPRFSCERHRKAG